MLLDLQVRVRLLMRLQGESHGLLNLPRWVRLPVRTLGENQRLLSPLLLLLGISSTSTLLKGRTPAPFGFTSLSSFLGCRSNLVVGRGRRRRCSAFSLQAILTCAGLPTC